MQQQNPIFIQHSNLCELVKPTSKSDYIKLARLQVLHELSKSRAI
jgi:hypothetical protein